MADPFELHVDFGNFGPLMSEMLALVSYLGPTEFPEFYRTSEEASEAAETRYKGYLLGDPLPSGKRVERPSGASARGVRRNPAGFLAWTLMNDAPAADALEEGTKERDMKDSLPSSKRARMSKDGHLYLIIPFRQGVPGTRGLSAMPKEIYAMAKVLAKSRALGAASNRTSATGYTVPRWSYAWNGRLQNGAGLQAAGIDPAISGRYAGLVRVGRGGHTSYMTFRVMSQASPKSSWVRKAQPGLWPLRTAIDITLADYRERLEKAVEADILGALGQASSGPTWGV